MGYYSKSSKATARYQRRVTTETWNYDAATGELLGTSSSVTPYPENVSERTVHSVQRSSQGTPQFSKVQRLGHALPMHPFSFVETRTELSTGTYSFTSITTDSRGRLLSRTVDSQDGTGGYLAVEAAIGSVPAASERKLKNSVLMAARLKVSDSKVNVAQMFAERKQVSDMIYSTATTLARVVSSLRRGNLPGAYIALGLKRPSHRKAKGYYRDFENRGDAAAANAWLQMQYGWRPLLSDIYGSCEQLAKASRPQRDIIRLRRSGSVSKASHSDTGNTGGTGILRYSESRYDVSVSVRYRMTSPSLQGMASVGMVNPASLAWELLPFSFVVDWFLPVGNYLEAITATTGCTFLDGCVTEYRKSVGTCVSRGFPTMGPHGAVGHSGTKTGREERVTCERTILTDFPSAGAPSFSNPFSPGHALNAVALLRQSFPKG